MQGQQNIKIYNNGDKDLIVLITANIWDFLQAVNICLHDTSSCIHVRTAASMLGGPAACLNILRPLISTGWFRDAKEDSN